MNPRTIPAKRFDLPRFVAAIVDHWGDHEVAFPLVKGGYADFGTACLGDDDAGDTPLGWLNHGHVLFAQFTRRDGTTYTLPGGVEIDVSDVDDDDATFLDDSSTYGFLVHLKGDTLLIQTAVLRDITGECVVTVVEDAGVFEADMRRFVEALKLPV